MRVNVKNLCFSYSENLVLDEVNFKAEAGEIIAFLGPNGVGKTTLFRCMLGFLKPQSGSVIINDKDINDYSKRELAKQIAYIPQNLNPVFNNSVLDSVLMGSASQLGVFEQPGDNLNQKALKILDSLGIKDLADKGCMKISGGEKQLVLIARALMQDARILIMDEPTANLDFGNSYRVMKKVFSLAKSGYCVIYSTHNPSQALNFSDRIVAINDGHVLCDCPSNSFDCKILNDLYGIETLVCEHCNSVIIKP